MKQRSFSFFAAWWWFTLWAIASYGWMSAQEQRDWCINEGNKKVIIEEYIQQHNKSIGKVYAAYLANGFIKAGEEFGVDPFLLVAVGQPESGFNRLAVSDKGALGVMQVMPFWVNHIPFIKSKEDLLNPEKNIRAGAYILAGYIRQCGGLKQGIQCYHGGPRSLAHPKQVTLDHVENILNKYRDIEII